jgi:hypothetical protein
MGLARIEIDTTNWPGPNTLFVDGIDLSNVVNRVTFDAKAGVHDGPPRLYLEGVGVGRIEALGVVVEKVSDVLAIQEFLASVDTDKLEAEALEGIGLESGMMTVGQAIIAKLMEWAGGNQDGT